MNHPVAFGTQQMQVGEFRLIAGQKLMDWDRMVHFDIPLAPTAIPSLKIKVTSLTNQFASGSAATLAGVSVFLIMRGRTFWPSEPATPSADPYNL